MNRHGHVWIDCEFNGWGGDLISLALVDAYGREFYEAVPCAYPQPWVAANVMPVLGVQPVPLRALQQRLHWWLSAYDSVHVIADWPDDIAYFCRALITGPGERMDTPHLTLEIRRDIDAAASMVPHNALEDARAIRRKHLQLMAQGARRIEPRPAGGLSPNSTAARAGDQPEVVSLSARTRAQNLLSDARAEGAETPDAGSAGVVSASGASLVAATSRPAGQECGA